VLRIPLILILLAIPALTAAQVRPAPPRPVPAPMTGTATLSGTVVTEDADARPVRRAAVMLFAPGDVRRQWVASTDDNGRFAFGALPGGNYSLYASKPGYVRAHYGATRAGSTVGVPVAVTDGQTVTNLSLKMARGAVITGNVFDERGRPMSAVNVRVRRVTRGSDGTRALAAISLGMGTGLSTTDDRGVYRAYGLAPGEYVVSAEPVILRPGLAGATDGTELRQPTDAELQWAERQLRPGAAAPEPPPATGQSITYAEVFHPGVVDQSAATPITLNAGEERTAIDLRMRFVPTARVTGAVVDRNGQPASAVRVTLLPRAAILDEPQRQVLGDVGLITADRSQTTAADGTFTLRGIEPGQYTLIARGLERSTPPVTLWASADVDVNGRDIGGVSLALAPSMAISGRVSFEGSAPPESARIQLRLTPAQAGLTATSTLAALTAAAPAFTIPGVVPGRYRLSVVLAGPTVGTTLPWSLKHATVGGRDVADTVFDVRPGENLTDVVLTLSDAMASVSGVVTDAAGRASSDLSLLLFSVDRAQWFGSSRHLRAPVRAASDGRFTFTGLPAGAYYLAAVNDFEPNGWFSPEFLDQLIASAIKITVADGEKKVQDLRISR
jgi:hypothetical protein